MLKIENLAKNFGSFNVFENVNLEVMQGDVIVILGPSGCGKSTFLRCINLMETPSAGSITVFGRTITSKGIKAKEIDEIRSKIGMVYQSFNLYSNKNVLENLILAPMAVHKFDKSTAIARAMKVLPIVGMEQRAFHMPEELSGGQKQRAAIARCLMMNPDIILFDEPTSALDPTMVDEVLSIIKYLVKQKTTTCVIVTHEMEFAKSIATKIVYMDEHGIYESGTPDEIFNSPKRERTQIFVNRLKTYNEEITKTNCDIYAFMSNIMHYCVNFGFEKRQLNFIRVVYEELILPLIHATQDSIHFSLRCNEKTGTKDVFLRSAFPLLSHPTLDPLGVNMVKGLAASLESNVDADGDYLHILF